jgi:hypothetical protein
MSAKNEATAQGEQPAMDGVERERYAFILPVLAGPVVSIVMTDQAFFQGF